jgi:hypothetical protein
VECCKSGACCKKDSKRTGCCPKGECCKSGTCCSKHHA